MVGEFDLVDCSVVGCCLVSWAFVCSGFVFPKTGFLCVVLELNCRLASNSESHMPLSAGIKGVLCPHCGQCEKN